MSPTLRASATPPPAILSEPSEGSASMAGLAGFVSASREDESPQPALAYTISMCADRADPSTIFSWHNKYDGDARELAAKVRGVFSSKEQCNRHVTAV